jgi:hypothetical protein
MKKIILFSILFIFAACTTAALTAEPALDAGVDAMVTNHTITPEQAAQLKVVIHEVLAGIGGGGINWGAILGGVGTLIGGVFGVSFLNRARSIDQLAQIGLDQEALKKVAALVAPSPVNPV